MNLPGWTQEKIGEMMGLSQNRVSEIIGNTDFGKISAEMQGHLKQGWDKAWLNEANPMRREGMRRQWRSWIMSIRLSEMSLGYVEK